MLSAQRASDFWSRDAVIRPAAVLETGARRRQQGTQDDHLLLRLSQGLEAYLAAEGLPLEPPSIRAFLAAERDRTSPASAAKHYRNPRVYFRWLLAEDEIKEDPMVRVEKPQVAEEAKPFFTGAELASLLETATRTASGTPSRTPGLPQAATWTT
jgi:hypothetical protein